MPAGARDALNYDKRTQHWSAPEASTSQRPCTRPARCYSHAGV